VPAFDVTLGGQEFTFQGSGGAFSWEAGGIYFVSDTSSWSIRRKDGGDFILTRLDFDGKYGPSDMTMVQPRRDGTAVGGARLVDVMQPESLAFASLQVDEIVFSGGAMTGLGLSMFAGDSMTAAAPNIASLSPGSGGTAGGNTVTITGSGFSGASAVRFGSVNAAAFTIIGDTQITATTPAHAAGGVYVSVTTAGGTSATGPSSEFTFGSPPAAGAVTVGSAPYNSGGNVQFNFSIAPFFSSDHPTAYAVGSPTTSNGGAIAIDNVGNLTYTAPLYFNGNDTVTYTVTNAGGTSNAGNLTIAVARPSFQATLTGAGQAGSPLSNVAISVTGGRAPYSCAATPASGQLPIGVQLNANCTLTGTPTQGGSFPFTATITDSSTGPVSATSNQLILDIASPPTVTAISPSAGPAAGGTSVVITGTNFGSTSSVRFGATLASYTVLS
ncbi:MAG: IPT/TIG domain-containing protein, partial [Pseudomonas sp.]